MAKPNAPKQSEAKAFLNESASANSQGSHVSESESPKASADKTADKVQSQKSAKAEVKPAGKVEDLPRKFHKFA